MSANEFTREIGNFSIEFKNGDLFRVKWSGTEIIQRIYVAVRDEPWNTIPASISNVKVEENSSSLFITFNASHVYQDIDYDWAGSIKIQSQGELTLTMHGKANKYFKYSKIGFNIHHGLKVSKDLTFSANTLEGAYQGRFGNELIPQFVKDGKLTAMTPHFDKLTINYQDFNLNFEFVGDRFEMQDHRNWCDANWKTYGTPLELGFPFEAERDQVFIQEIRIKVEDNKKNPPDIAGNYFTQKKSPKLPLLGIRLKSIPSFHNIENLAKLNLSHLRIDLMGSNPDWDFFQEATKIAQSLGIKLEIALFIPPDFTNLEISSLVSPFIERAEIVQRLLVLTEKFGYSAFQGATDPKFAISIKNMTENKFEIFSGTDQFFSDINRVLPDYSSIDGLVFALNPQVHACDEISIMQNASALESIVEYIDSKYVDALVSLSPIELIGESGPFPGGPEGKFGFAPNEDLRQKQQFTAAWTGALIAHAANCQVHTMTFYEVNGNRGFMDDDGNVFPSFEILRQINELSQKGYILNSVQGDSEEDIMIMNFKKSDAQCSLAMNLSSVVKTVKNSKSEDLTLQPYESLIF